MVCYKANLKTRTIEEIEAISIGPIYVVLNTGTFERITDDLEYHVSEEKAIEKIEIIFAKKIDDCIKRLDKYNEELSHFNHKYRNKALINVNS